MHTTIKRLGRGVVAGLGGSLIVALVAGPAAATSMKDAMRLALSHSPDVGNVAHNREAIEQELRQARGLYLPQIDVAAGIGKERTNDRNTRADVNNRNALTLTRQESSLTVQQRIFDGFETDSTVKREKARITSAALRVFENSEFTGLDAIGAYLEVLRQRELVRLSEENVQVHQLILGFLREQLAGGAGSAADVSQTEARLARAETTLSQTINALRDGESSYARIVGQYPDDLTPVGFDSTLPPDLDTAVELVWRNNPTFKIFDAEVRVAEAEVDLAEVPLYPAITLEGESEYNRNRDGIEAGEFNNQIMLRLRWNLFRGGIDSANRQEAVTRVSQQKAIRHRALLEAEEEMRRSWFALEANRRQIEEYTRDVQFQTETRDAYRQQFEVGQRTLLDVLDAENELFVAKGQLVTSQTNVELASYRILALTGQLLDAMEIAPPEQASTVIPTFGEQLF
ncbi:MAG: TolC family outer membrane protein [Kiloniellales bacterium]|nr:TolC family outer membrane protein [Kiloniellales bacterium]